MDNYPEIASRVERLEQDVRDIKITLHSHGVADVRLEEKLNGLESQVLSIKHDVITTLNQHSVKTWGLVNQGIKVICVLVGVVCGMAGVKLLPDIIQLCS